MSSYFDDYVNRVQPDALRSAIEQTRDKFQSNVLDNFSWIGTKQVLLYGDVQSGKTSHMLGLIAHAVDNNIRTILVLTSDNTILVDQTFKRALSSFKGFNVCDSTDEKRFRYNATEEDNLPTLIVLNKNGKVLSRWRQLLASTSQLHGSPVMIVDDEADAASLDNNVSRKNSERTTINRELTRIRDQATACIYLQVTGTPQAILLQASLDGWRPDYAFSFEPGDSYIGGSQLFKSFPHNPHLRVSNSLSAFRDAVINHLVVATIYRAEGRPVCNMLVHPSQSTSDHSVFHGEALRVIDDLRKQLDSPRIQAEIESIVADLRKTFSDPIQLDEITLGLRELIDNHEFKLHQVNSVNPTVVENDWSTGANFLFGGNALGRGVTIPQLQTVYYCRESKSPQADTLWQHCRVFGYDRRPELLRVYMPGNLAKVFCEVNEGNLALKRQISKTGNLDDIQVILDSTVRPTRPSVLNRRILGSFNGGVNYFAANPVIENFADLDQQISILFPADGDTAIDYRSALTLLDYFDTDEDDFPLDGFKNAIEQLSKDKRDLKVSILVRRGRKITQGTGSLLSESDRKWADSIHYEPVLVLYRIENDQTDYGWNDSPIWVPNVKLPVGRVYYRSK